MECFMGPHLSFLTWPRLHVNEATSGYPVICCHNQTSRFCLVNVLHSVVPRQECVTPAPKKPVIPVGVHPALRPARSRFSAAWSAAPSVSLCLGGMQRRWREERAAGK